MKFILVFLYLIFIILSNVLTAKIKPLEINNFFIPIGTFFIGFTFILRDLVQYFFNRKKTYYFIIIAMILSAITSKLLGDSLWIVFASIITFAISETTDTEIYTRLKSNQSLKVLISGIISGILDSSIFVIIGLSPIGANFIAWNFVFMAIIGQIVVKIIIQIISSIIIWFYIYKN